MRREGLNGYLVSITLLAHALGVDGSRRHAKGDDVILGSVLAVFLLLKYYLSVVFHLR